MVHYRCSPRNLTAGRRRYLRLQGDDPVIGFGRREHVQPDKSLGVCFCPAAFDQGLVPLAAVKLTFPPVPVIGPAGHLLIDPIGYGYIRQRGTEEIGRLDTARDGFIGHIGCLAGLQIDFKIRFPIGLNKEVGRLGVTCPNAVSAQGCLRGNVKGSVCGSHVIRHSAKGADHLILRIPDFYEDAFGSGYY